MPQSAHCTDRKAGMHVFVVTVAMFGPEVESISSQAVVQYIYFSFLFVCSQQRDDPFMGTQAVPFIQEQVFLFMTKTPEMKLVS